MPLFLTGLWLLLNESISPGTIALGVILSILLLLAASRLRPLRARPRHIRIILRLIRDVVVDILKSNVAVGLLVWKGGRKAGMSPGFLDIPLTLRDPHGLAALACIITYTPGTVWAGLCEETHTLTLHVLDLKNEEYWIRTIQDRYERPLMEIFE